MSETDAREVAHTEAGKEVAWGEVTCEAHNETSTFPYPTDAKDQFILVEPPCGHKIKFVNPNWVDPDPVEDEEGQVSSSDSGGGSDKVS